MLENNENAISRMHFFIMEYLGRWFTNDRLQNVFIINQLRQIKQKSAIYVR